MSCDVRFQVRTRSRRRNCLILCVVFLLLIVFNNVNLELYASGVSNAPTKPTDQNIGKRYEKLRGDFSYNRKKSNEKLKEYLYPVDLNSSSEPSPVEKSHTKSLDPCFQSPYFLCGQEPTKPITNRTFHVAYLRRPDWQSRDVFNFSRCRFSNCVYQDENVTASTDVVLVYGLKLSDSYPVPKRWPHQVYVLANWEPPDRVKAEFLTNGSSLWNHAFNLTLTYILDSDIPAVYFRLKPNPNGVKSINDYYQIAKQKNRTAVWIVSRCEVPSKRLHFVKEMKKYIDVDVYGACGKRCTLPTDDCTELFPQYKFYLSFENSFCPDYVTEKLFKHFVPDRHIIPVVRGGGSYDRYFPHGLFINAGHFSSPRSLALYLEALGSDHEMYSRYLERKDAYLIGELTHQVETGCVLCEHLHTRELKPKVYDMNQLFKDGRCKTPSEITWPKY